MTFTQRVKRFISQQFMRDQRGMSLFSTALFVMVVGVMMGGFITLQDQMASREAQEETREKSLQIQRALDEFIAQQGRLPCPASMTAGLDAAGFGTEAVAPGACGAAALTLAVNGVATGAGADGVAVQIGTLPVRVLNLPDTYIVDNFGHRFVYAVTAPYTVPGADFDNGMGDISVNDSTGAPTGSGAANMLYVLMSQGEDSAGAYTLEGLQPDVCAGGANCTWQTVANPPATFVQQLKKTFSIGNEFTQSFAFKASSVAYQWSSGPWGSCNPNCQTGTRTRVVECQRVIDGFVVPDTNCDAAIRPANSELCGFLGSCQWTTGSWSNCSAECGNGTQSRPVACNDLDNLTVADGFCAPAPKPNEAQACNLGEGYWDMSNWGSCSPNNGTCGDGSQSRSVSCLRDTDNASVAESCCSSSKPTESQTCTENTCGSWVLGSWGACSASCGGGTQSASYSCQGGSCTTPQPADETQNCNTDACVTYDWVELNDWSACSALCGDGIQTQTVECRDSNGNVAAEMNCVSAKPSETRACNLGPCIPTGNCPSGQELYYYIDGGSCSDWSSDATSLRALNAGESIAFDCANPSCSGTTQQFVRNQGCSDVISSTLNHASCTVRVDGECGPAHNVAVSSAPTDNLCTTGEPTPVHWTGTGGLDHGHCVDGCGAWLWECEGLNGGETSHTCVAAKETSAPTNGQCGSADGQSFTSTPTASDGLCDNGKATTVSGSGPWTWTCEGSGIDAVDEDCEALKTEAYSWYSAPTYGACSKSCGGGTQTRLVECRNNSGVKVADSNCSGSKPSASKSCNTHSCSDCADDEILVCESDETDPGGGQGNATVDCSCESCPSGQTPDTSSRQTIYGSSGYTKCVPALTRSMAASVCPNDGYSAGAGGSCDIEGYDISLEEENGRYYCVLFEYYYNGDGCAGGGFQEIEEISADEITLNSSGNARVGGGYSFYNICEKTSKNGSRSCDNGNCMDESCAIP